jgi:type IV secretion system protein VirD4
VARIAERRRQPLLAVERSQSLAVIGPTQSGKTSSCAVPAILEWDGPVLAVSVKTDLLHGTVDWRRSVGTVWCFDPGGATGVAADRWEPLGAARTWAGARRLAADLTEVTRGRDGTPDAEFWYATAAKLLAPLLFAAATDGRSMADVVRWVDTQERHEVVDIVETAGHHDALQALRASWARDERQQSSVYTTAETVLEGFNDTTEGEDRPSPSGAIDPEALLDGPHTLYVCAPAHDQRRLQSVFVALVKEVLHRAFARSARTGTALSPPLLVVLDEAANIAPLAELDSLAATCAGHGVQLVTVWQDLAQVAARYGRRAPTVINNHRAKLFLSGISDPDTLDHAARLVGEEEVGVPVTTRGRAGERSTTVSVQRRPLLSAGSLRRLPPGTGVLIYGSLPPVRVALRPWWANPELARRSGRGPTPVASDGR